MMLRVAFLTTKRRRLERGCFSKQRPLRPAPFGELHEELFADVGGHLSVKRDQFV